MLFLTNQNPGRTFQVTSTSVNGMKRNLQTVSFKPEHSHRLTPADARFRLPQLPYYVIIVTAFVYLA